MKKFLMLLLLLLPLTITSCGSDDKDEPNVPNEPNSTTQSNYTATTSVKTVTIHDKEESYNNGDNSNGGVTFYEDYNNLLVELNFKQFYNEKVAHIADI